MPPSTADRFEALAQRTRVARDRGDYGIAAGFVVRADGREVTCFGENSVFTRHDPTGHAESNALRLAGRRSAGVVAPDDEVAFRDAPGEGVPAGERHVRSYWWSGRVCRLPAGALRRRQVPANL